MPPWAKLTIGLAAASAAAWIGHGPAGRGAAFVDGLEAQAQAVVAKADVPGVTVRMARDPLARTAILVGPADRFQREGQGSFPGLNDRVAAIAGIGGVEWANPPPAGRR